MQYHQNGGVEYVNDVSKDGLATYNPGKNYRGHRARETKQDVSQQK